MARMDADRRTIALLNQKGGVGKTTSTVNLGAALADAGRPVCLIDLDPQAHLTLHLGLDGSDIETSVYDLFVDPDVTAASVRRNLRENLDLLPAVVDLAAAEVELADHPDRQRILKRKFEPIAAEYEFILIDCPPSLGLLTLNALAMAREVFVPMQAHFLALQGVGKLLETVGLVCRSVNPTLKVSGIILCMHEGNTTLSREVVADLEGFFERSRDEDVPWRDCRVLQPPVRRNIKLAEAPSFGATIFDYEPWCPGAIDYRRLAKGIIAEWDRHLDERARPEEPGARPEGPFEVSAGQTAVVETEEPAQIAQPAQHHDDDMTQSAQPPLTPQTVQASQIAQDADPPETPAGRPDRPVVAVEVKTGNPASTPPGPAPPNGMLVGPVPVAARAAVASEHADPATVAEPVTPERVTPERAAESVSAESTNADDVDGVDEPDDERVLTSLAADGDNAAG